MDQCSCMRASGLCGLHLLESNLVPLGAKASASEHSYTSWANAFYVLYRTCVLRDLITLHCPCSTCRSIQSRGLLCFLDCISLKIKICFSIHGVATHHLCCKPDSERAIELGAYICVLSLLFLSPQSSFSLVQHSLLSFLLRKGMKPQAWHPGVAGGSTGAHTVEKIKDRRKETERDHMFIY